MTFYSYHTNDDIQQYIIKVHKNSLT